MGQSERGNSGNQPTQVGQWDFDGTDTLSPKHSAVTQISVAATGGSGATTALDNLASVAINTSLISDTDNTDDLGSAAKIWKDVYLAAAKYSGSTSGTTTVQATAVAGTTTLTLPAATDTLVGKATTDTFTNKSGSNSQWTNDEGYTTNTGTVTPSTTDTFTNKTMLAASNVLDDNLEDIAGLADPGGDRLLYFRSSAGTIQYASAGNFLSFSSNNLNVSGLMSPSTTDTMTNKTFDANATGNNLSNVDVADLANGTDGELITWSATGVATTVGVGTSAQVLTSNGAGAAPTFQTVAGGGNKSIWISGNACDFAGGSSQATSGNMPVIRTADSTTSSIDCTFVVPTDFSALDSLQVYWKLPGGAHPVNLHMSEMLCGVLTAGDTTTSTDNVNATTLSTTAADALMTSDISGAINGLTLNAGDVVSILFTRDAGNAGDTINAVADIYGFLFKYS